MNLKTKILIYFVCSIFTLGIKAQSSNYIDSLLNLLDENQIDTNQLHINREIAKYYYDINAKKAIEYYTQSKKLSELLGNQGLTANSNYSLGLCYMTLGDFDKAIDHYLRAVRYFEETQNNRNTSLIYSEIANLYAQFGKYDKAFEYYRKSGDLIQVINDTFEMIYLFQGISSVFFKQEKFDSCLVYNFKAKSLVNHIGEPALRFGILANIGLVYKRKKDYRNALLYTDSAFQCTGLGLISDFEVADLYNNYACIYTEMGKYAEAEKAFHKSLKLCKSTNNTTSELENYKNMASLFAKTSDYKNQVLYLNNYYSLKDSLYNIESKTQLSQLESDYQIEKKDKLISKSKLETIQQKNNRNVFLLISLFSVALLSLLYFYYKKSQGKNQLLLHQNQKIEHQKTELEKLNQLKDRLFGIISHDLRNPLITLRSYLLLSDNESLSADKKLLFKNQTMSAVTQTSDLLDNLLTWANLQLRNTETRIVPTDIEECIAEVVDSVDSQAKQKSIQLIQKVEPIQIPSNSDILAIALRNIISNAIKFSKHDSHIIISTILKPDHVLINIQDFGIGLSSLQIKDILENRNESTEGTEGERGSGLGLYLVKEMLKKINAQLLIESELGKGSLFSIMIEK